MVVAEVVVTDLVVGMVMGMIQLETEVVIIVAKELANRRRCLSHTVLANSRLTHVTLSKNRSSCKCKRISRIQRKWSQCYEKKTRLC